jgi:hypothetical protein
VAFTAAAESSVPVAWKEAKTEDAVSKTLSPKFGGKDAKSVQKPEVVRPNIVVDQSVVKQVAQVKKKPVIDAQSPVFNRRRAADDKNQAKANESKSKVTSQTKRNTELEHADKHKPSIWDKLPIAEGLRMGKALGIGAVGMGTVVTVVKGLLGGIQSDISYDPPKGLSGRLQRDTDWMNKVEWTDSEPL